MKVILALDLGTTGNRAVAFDKQGRQVAKAYQEFSQIFPQAGWVEHDAEEIWQSTRSVLEKVASEVGVHNIVSLGITNQRETTVLWNKKTGKPIYHAIVWQCRRTTEICRQLKTKADLFKQKTGLFLDPYFSGTKIKWILEHVEGAREQADKGEILFGTIDTWILWKLTAGKSHFTEVSNASRTLFFNIHTLSFDEELLKILTIPSNILPKILSSQDDFGLIDDSILGKEIPITGMLGDQQASLFAQGGWQKGVVKNTYGTGLFVMTSTGCEIPQSGKLVNTVAWKIGDEICYALEGSIFVGGSCIQWLRDELKIIDDAGETEAMAKSLKDNDDVYLVPAFVGLGAPFWDPEARGLIIGITRGTTRAHFIRAALESLAYQTRDVVEEMKKLIPDGAFKILRVDGGAVKNDFLMQFQSDILNLKVERPVQIETTVFGAAAIAGLGAGFWTREELNQIRQIDRTFEPQMPEIFREKKYLRWQRAVRKSLAWSNDSKKLMGS